MSQVGNKFRPFSQVGFPRPKQNDPRKVRPKETDAKFAEKLNTHNAFLLEQDVWMSSATSGMTSPVWCRSLARPTTRHFQLHNEECRQSGSPPEVCRRHSRGTTSGTAASTNPSMGPWCSPSFRRSDREQDDRKFQELKESGKFGILILLYENA